MPGPPCSVCQRQDVADVERMARGKGPGLGQRAAARRFGITLSVVQSHMAHTGKAPAEPEEPRGPQPMPPPPLAPDDIEGRLRQLATVADTLRADASAQGAPLQARGQALNASRATLREVAEILAKREAAREQNLLGSKQWAEVRAALVEALVPFPEAARAVGDVMRRIEAT